MIDYLLHVLLIGKCVRRSLLLKNAKKYNRFEHEYYLDRGDFYNHASGIRETKSVWIPCEQFRSRARFKRNKNRLLIFFKRGTS